MPDTTLTSAVNELKEHQRQLDMDGVEVGVSRQALDIVLLSLARAGLEAGKADESMAARDVLAERKRQVEAEGWTPEHDDKHAKGEMAKAAASYAVDNVSLYPPGQWNSERRSIADWLWPWDMRWWKPTNRRRNLVKAGALILAEIERLDRTAIRALPITGGDKP